MKLQAVPWRWGNIGVPCPSGGGAAVNVQGFQLGLKELDPRSRDALETDQPPKRLKPGYLVLVVVVFSFQLYFTFSIILY